MWLTHFFNIFGRPSGEGLRCPARDGIHFTPLDLKQDTALNKYKSLPPKVAHRGNTMRKQSMINTKIS